MSPRRRKASAETAAATAVEGRPPAADAGPLVVVDGVHVSFGEHRVLEGVSLAIRRGETVALLGESGSGKTVLLRVILGLQAVDAGRVRLFGTDVAGTSDEEMEGIRRRIAVVYQGGALYSGMTVAENIALELREVLGLPKAEVDARVRASLEAVGLAGVDPDLSPDSLSGGMKKRLAIARAVAPRPELVFYDEPTSGLDPINSARILDLIRELHDREAATSVVVTHDVRGASRIADRLVLISGGKIAFDGPPERFRDSDDPAVRAFRAATEAARAEPASPRRDAPPGGRAVTT